MATPRPPWSVPGVILFSHGDLSYEVDLSRPLLEELSQSRLGERIVPAWERTEKKRLREVIVRSLPPASPGDPEMLERMRARLREEAHLATYLRHPGIARTLGPYEVQGALYIVSDRVEGTSINSLLTYSLMREKLLSPAFCLYVGAEVASALHYAHTCKGEDGAPLGIVHRDLNPARIFLEPEGGVMLTDFARARSLLPGRVASTLPRPQGDVFYCSPEALLCGETDPRSDLFSLGLVLLELATWRHLYSMVDMRPSDLEEALTKKVKVRVLDAAITAMEADLPAHADDCILRAATFTREEVDELTEPLPQPLRSIIRKLIQRHPEERYPSAADVEADLRAGLAALGVPYGPEEALEEVLSSLSGARLSRDTERGGTP
ncbi:serine/threonine protein kinase [Hyalangium gracile]|uniref:serine/threonine protein kinase n=1 Tax=Hyalangium gracile TaxID=394092 RepID=UPI001CCF676E|nr:serine/threonine-protein kinase [Hyalangium gracile]